MPFLAQIRRLKLAFAALGVTELRRPVRQMWT